MSSGGDSETFEEIEGVFSWDLMFPGLTVDSFENSLFVLGPAFDARLAEELFAGEGGRGDSGSGLSSNENIDKSSPFHWSPR